MLSNKATLVCVIIIINIAVVPSEFEGEEYIKQERVTQHELA
jgi:hypothetical protein